MSHTHAAAAPCSYFQSILNDATGEYERRHTRKSLLPHPLAAQLEFCNSPSCIIFLIKQLAQELNLSQRIDDQRSIALARYTPRYEPVGSVPLSSRPTLKAIFMSTGVGLLYSVCTLPTSIAFARAIIRPTSYRRLKMCGPRTSCWHLRKYIIISSTSRNLHRGAANSRNDEYTHDYNGRGYLHSCDCGERNES
jgi:hypothetical protein